VGQQQLLLIILGVVVVGIAIAVGITMFADSAASSNREQVVGDLLYLSAKAQEYYRKPTTNGGGGYSFTGLGTTSITLLTNSPSNANGIYSIETAGSGSGVSSTVTIKGVGIELFNGSPVAARIFVYPDRDSVVVIN